MEQNQMNNKGDHCVGCNCSWGAKSETRRIIIMVLGMLLAFWLGMKLGEIKGFMHSMYGDIHHSYRADTMYRDQGMNMVKESPIVMPSATPAETITP